MNFLHQLLTFFTRKFLCSLLIGAARASWTNQKSSTRAGCIPGCHYIRSLISTTCPALTSHGHSNSVQYISQWIFLIVGKFFSSYLKIVKFKLGLTLGYIYLCILKLGFQLFLSMLNPNKTFELSCAVVIDCHYCLFP